MSCDCGRYNVNITGFGRGGGGRGGGGVMRCGCGGGGMMGRGRGRYQKPGFNLGSKFSAPGKKMWRCSECFAENFMHRSKCFKCGEKRIFNVKPVLSVDTCKCGCKKIVKHGTCGVDVSFYDIPLEVFIPLILSKLTMNDICNIAQIDKENNLYFSCNEIWQVILNAYIVKKSYPIRLKHLANTRVRKNDTMNWSRDEIDQNYCTLLVENKTNSIPMDVYWVNGFGYKKMNKNGPIPPNERFITRSYPNHKWFCVPTKEWMTENPCSNVGFTFGINVLELTEYKFNNTTKLVFAREFHEPRDIKPIKGFGKKYANVKKEFLRQTQSKEKFAEIYRSNKEIQKKLLKEQEELQRKLKLCQQNLSKFQKKEKTIMWVQKELK